MHLPGGPIFLANRVLLIAACKLPALYRALAKIGRSADALYTLAQAARTFDVSLSSVKRYVNKAKRGGSLAPKKSPGSTPKLDQKAMKLLEEDIKERPYLTLRERREYMKALSGVSVSRSTLCRAIARIGPTRKKGGE